MALKVKWKWVLQSDQFCFEIFGSGQTFVDEMETVIFRNHFAHKTVVVLWLHLIDSEMNEVLIDDTYLFIALFRVWNNMSLFNGEVAFRITQNLNEHFKHNLTGWIFHGIFVVTDMITRNNYRYWLPIFFIHLYTVGD